MNWLQKLKDKDFSYVGAKIKLDAMKLICKTFDCEMATAFKIVTDQDIGNEFPCFLQGGEVEKMGFISERVATYLIAEKAGSVI